MKEKIILVLCPDLNGFHENVFHISYIFFPSGLCVEEPTLEQAKSLHTQFENMEWEIVYLSCGHCKAKGVSGISHFTIEELNELLKQKGVG